MNKPYAGLLAEFMVITNKATNATHVVGFRFSEDHSVAELLITNAVKVIQVEHNILETSDRCYGLGIRIDNPQYANYLMAHINQIPPSTLDEEIVVKRICLRPN